MAHLFPLGALEGLALQLGVRLELGAQHRQLVLQVLHVVCARHALA